MKESVIPEEPVLVNTGQGFSVRYRNRYLYSSMHPAAGCEKQASRLEITERTLVFLPSPCLGYGIRCLLNMLPENTHLLCVEVDEKLFALTQRSDIADIPADPRLTVVRTESGNELIRIVKKLGISRFRRVITCQLSGGFSLYREKYEQLFRIIDEEIRQHWKNKITLVHMAPLWIRNIFLNLPLFPGAENLASFKTGSPVIVAGAGPSLEESLEEIRSIRDRALLIAVDTALPFFIRQNIMPDFVFMLESQLANIFDFMNAGDISISLICDISAYPGAVRLFRGKVYLFSSSFAGLGLFSRMEERKMLPAVIPALGSVGVAAIYAALRMTTGPVFVTGFDFGYTKNVTHARETAFYQFAQLLSSRFTPADGITYRNIRKRPLLIQKGKRNERLLTDMVLCSYARQIPGIVVERDNIFDLGNHGLDLGIPRIRQGEAVQIIEKAGSGQYLSYEAEPDFIRPDKQTIAGFIASEKGILEKNRKLVSALLEKGESGVKKLREEDNAVLSAIDYAYLHFPDQDILPNADRSFLFRTLISIKHYEAVLDKAAQLPGQSG